MRTWRIVMQSAKGSVRYFRTSPISHSPLPLSPGPPPTHHFSYIFPHFFFSLRSRRVPRDAQIMPHALSSIFGSFLRLHYPSPTTCIMRQAVIGHPPAGHVPTAADQGFNTCMSISHVLKVWFPMSTIRIDITARLCQLILFFASYEKKNVVRVKAVISTSTFMCSHGAVNVIGRSLSDPVT